jgi:hypothetical protein
MSPHISLKSAVQLHIWQHVEMEVCLDGSRVDRRYVDSRGETVYKEFVVEAQTGLLRQNRTRRSCYRPSLWTAPA